eukprot:CAMPEP_0194104682 /NCGR_PEP_ID=MMETSP0150-20130528/5019_1 /TAXON_ID=122233 /ORGANISM="Chaetoceros debilis, Strain MM31A-1" /LENGTH=561 /DNA_ID=CAMNT_0038792311 /DNA_START=41 /DNA_END=1723 /DNA_ORIENTATION=-
MAKQQQRRGRYYYRCMYVSLVLAAFLSMNSNWKSLQKLKQIDTNTYGIPTSLLDEGNSPTGSKKVAFENGKDSSNDADADNDNDDKNRVKEKATTDDYSSSSSSTIDNIVINKPNLIMHIGPSKTGTSTIQKSSRTFTNILAKDAYIYAGKFGVIKPAKKATNKILKVDDCFFETEAYLLNRTRTAGKGSGSGSGSGSSGNSTDTDDGHRNNSNKNNNKKATDVPCWKKRVARLNTLYLENNTNVIWSDEAYSFAGNTKVHTQHVYEIFRTIFQDDWNLSFVVTYRRYAEWLLSALKQSHHRVRCVGEKSAWHTKERDKPSNNKCQTPYKFVLQSFKELKFIGKKQEKDKKVQNYKSFSTNIYKNIDVTTSMLQSANIPVKILNFHDEQHITSSFYCDIIPNAPHTCQHTIDATKRPGKNSSSAENVRVVMSASCSTIVFAAAQEGMSGMDTATQTRHEATLACMDFMSTNNITHADLPLICPRRLSLEALLEKSLAFEKKMVPDFFASERGEVEHRELFWTMAEERRELCHVNTKELLEGKISWEEVLKSLKEKKRSSLA